MKRPIVFVVGCLALLLLLATGHSPAQVAGGPVQAQSLRQAGTWEQVASPGDVLELAVLDGYAYARTAEALYRSEDGASSWVTLTTGLDTGALNAMDADAGKLYVATNNGVAVSEDDGGTFAWSFPWTWDATMDVDFADGYGWSVVRQWGSRSGPNRKTPEGGWELRLGDLPASNKSLFWTVVDPTDPENVAYVGYDGASYPGGRYRTLDGGAHWTLLGRRVLFATVLDGSPVAIAAQDYSPDRGETWQPLGIQAGAVVKEEASGRLIAAAQGGGVYAGLPGDWTYLGLEEQTLRALAICEGQLLAASVDGDIYRMPLHLVYLPYVVRDHRYAAGLETFYLGQRSRSTCAEHDSYVVPVASVLEGDTMPSGAVTRAEYRIRATHPATEVHPSGAHWSAWCAADWENCPDAGQSGNVAAGCGVGSEDTVTKAFDNVQEQVYLLDGAPDIGTFEVVINGQSHGRHTGVILGSRWGTAESWSHDGVIYANGFTRWKPQGEAPGAETDPCFGTSIILGPYQADVPFLSDGYSPNPLRHPQIEAIAITVGTGWEAQMTGAFFEEGQRRMDVSWSLARLDIDPTQMLVSVSQRATALQDLDVYRVLGVPAIGQVAMSSMYADLSKHDADTQIGPGAEIPVGDIPSANEGSWGQESDLHRLPHGASLCLETREPTTHNTGSPTLCVLWGWGEVQPR